MGQTRFTIKENDSFEKCPECGNNTEFLCKSNQHSEDCCEVWVECKCGFDPTSENGLERIEDVWGSRDRGNMIVGLSIWNEKISELKVVEN